MEIHWIWRVFSSGLDCYAKGKKKKDLIAFSKHGEMSKAAKRTDGPFDLQSEEF